jgi:enamine deaminase RidA (YjgF/YER057c/UK114 family)
MIKRTLPYGSILHEVVEHNGVLYLAGIVAEDLSRDMAGQAEDCMAQLKRLLESHKSDLAHVLQATIYIANLREKPAFDAVWSATFAEAHLPARAGIGVGDLGPKVKVELVVTAAVKAAASTRAKTDTKASTKRVLG